MTNTTPTELQARMEKLVRALADVPRDSVLGQSGYASEARAIVAELPKPVDPDVLAVREIIAATCLGRSFEKNDVLSGKMDDCDWFTPAVSAYKRIKADRA